MVDERQVSSGSRQRIDKWLFFARMIKSRSLAQTYVLKGNVRINGERIIQPSHGVRPGDKIELSLERRDIVLVVRLPGRGEVLSRKPSCCMRTSRRHRMKRRS